MSTKDDRCDLCSIDTNKNPEEALMIVNTEDDIAIFCSYECLGAWVQRNHISKGKIVK